MPGLSFSSSSRPACPVCGAERTTLPGATKNAWICRRCAHSFIGTAPGAEELREVYASYGYDGEVGRYSPPFLDAIIADLVASFTSYRRTNRLLDVGFGAGGVLVAAKAAGWEPHGVELSSAAVTYGRERDIGSLWEGDFLTLPLEKGSYDVVVMSELIEHLVDPEPFLRRAAELLRPGGLLYMTTPHGRGVSGRLLAADWSVLRPPEHLQLFSIDSARRAVRAAGFSRVSVYTQGVLPHELVAKLGSRLRRSSTAPIARAEDGAFPDRARRSVDLNGAISQRRAGRLAKRVVNAVLRFTTLGDSLRVRAER